MKTSQFISLVRYAQDECCGLPITHDVTAQTVSVHFRACDLDVANRCGDYAYVFDCTEIDDMFSNGKTGEDIIARAQFIIESEYCERCDTWEQDRDICQALDDYVCGDCMDGMRDCEDMRATYRDFNRTCL